MQTVKIKVTGKVQGVFYRQSTQEKAKSFDITGTVKNCDDESVEIIATGTKEQLSKLIAWCKQGPAKAKVSDVTVQELSLQLFNNFSIIRR